MASEVRLLPQPDSPTIASVSPARDGEVDAAHRPGRPARHRDLDPEAAHLEERRRRHARPSGAVTSRTASPRRLIAKISATSAAPGIAISQGLKKSWFFASAIISPQVKSGGCTPKAEEGERRLEKDGVGELDRGHHDQGAGDVRQDLLQQDPPGRASDRLRRDNELPARHLLGGAARHDGEAVPQEEPDHEHQDGQRVADERDHDECHEHHGQRQADRQDEVDQEIDAPAPISGGDSERRPDRARDEDRDEANQKRDPSTVDQAGEVVAAELVGAERMLPGAARIPDRRHEALAEILPSRVVRRQQRRQDRGEEDDEKDAAAGPEATVPQRPAQRHAAGRKGGHGWGGGGDHRGHRSADPDARVERGVEDVGDERQHGVGRGNDEEDRLDDLDVGPLDRLPREIAETLSEKTVSMTIEPPSMKPSCTAASDTTGMIAWRSP